MSLVKGFKVDAFAISVVKFRQFGDVSFEYKAVLADKRRRDSGTCGKCDVSKGFKAVPLVRKGCFTRSTDVTSFSLSRELSWRNPWRKEANT